MVHHNLYVIRRGNPSFSLDHIHGSLYHEYLATAGLFTVKTIKSFDYLPAVWKVLAFELQLTRVF